MRDLIDRLEKASGPDRALDAEISARLRIGTMSVPEWAYKNFPTWRARTDNRVEVVHDNGKGGAHFSPPHFTLSIDGALLSADHAWEYQISTLYGIADVEAPLNDERCAPTSVRRKDGNVPLALCTAFLSARIDIAEYEAALNIHHPAEK